jgi:hypothetical protein
MLFAFVSFAASAVYVMIKIALAPTVAETPEDIRIKGDYFVMLLQCVLGIVAMLLPGFLKRTIRLNVPSYMLMVYAVFLYCAIYLGEVRSFYYLVPHWDTVLHAFSGAMLGALGFSFVVIFNKTEIVPLQLSAGFVALFAFCFALSLGVLWEIYEFCADEFLHTNMQKYMLVDGTLLAGHAVLADTMKDLIVDALGAFVMSSLGFISLRYKKGWFEKIQLKIEAKISTKIK